MNEHRHSDPEAILGAVDQHAIISVADADGCIIEANAAFCAISGYAMEELQGRDHRIISSDVHPESFWVELRDTISAGTTWRGEICHRARDGSSYWVDSTIMPTIGADGRLEKYVAIGVDISRFKRFEAEATAHRDRLEAHRTELQSIIDAIPAFIYYKDARNTILDLNRTAADSIGLPPEKIRGRATEDFFPASDAAAYLEDDLEVIRSGSPLIGRTEYYEAGDNERRKIRTDKIPLAGPTGEFDRLVAIATDITEVTRAQQALEGLQARFERAVNGATEGLWDYCLTTGEVWYSDQFRNLIGLTPDVYDDLAPTLDALVELMHPLDRTATLDAIELHLGQDVPFDATYRLRIASGEYRWFRARAQATRNDAGDPLRMSGSITDINDQHNAESRLDLATRAASVGLWDWDVPSNTTYFSDTFYTMLGYEPGELPMSLQTWKDLVHPDDLDEAIADIQQHLEGKTPAYSNEHRLRCKDGSWRWIRDAGEIVERIDDGAPRRMIGVHVDIQAIYEARHAAEAASQAKSEFLANMSHEIRTPMTAILGFADLLASDLQLASDAERTADAVRTISGNARHLLTIINDILDMSKIEAGRMTIEQVAMNPIQITEEVASLVQPHAYAKNIAVRCAYETPIPLTVQSDGTRLRQILLNLVGNAIKFTNVGTVDVRVACDVANQQLRFAVADTGIGMSLAERESIECFNAFNQADTSTTRKFGGTGLGLRISNSLAELLGGGIEIESAPGTGSVFVATIATGSLDDVEMIPPDMVPSVAQNCGSTEPADPTAPSPERPLLGARILLAEDGPDNQKLITLHLRRAGATVTTAENGRVALAMIEAAGAEALPHLILMDMQMPEVDGYTATHRLRAAGCSLPIIALTAHAMSGDRQKCIDAGCDEYMTKPINRTTLIDSCARWFEQVAAVPLDDRQAE
ncbi:MAG: PAS domain-containing hybrid sensor histidine kinase/response regulator [Planctomycetota bacterium]